MGTLGLVHGRDRESFLSPNRPLHVGVWRGGGIKEPGRESDRMGSRLRMLGALSPLLQGVMLNYKQGKTFNLLKIRRVLFQTHCLVDAHCCFRSRDVDVKV
jgi:hypothetical protein